MGWRAAATVLISVFAIVLIQTSLAGPVTTTAETFNSTGDYNNDHFDGNAIMDSIVGDWFNMGLVAIFGAMLWGVLRIVRQELTRGRI